MIDGTLVFRLFPQRLRHSRVVTGLTLAIEVVSPESTFRDRAVKLRKYAAAGIPHYWLVEDEATGPVVHVYELDEPTRSYAPTGVHRDSLHVPAPFEIDIDLAKLMTGHRSPFTAQRSVVVAGREDDDFVIGDEVDQPWASVLRSFLSQDVQSSQPRSSKKSLTRRPRPRVPHRSRSARARRARPGSPRFRTP